MPRAVKNTAFRKARDTCRTIRFVHQKMNFEDCDRKDTQNNNQSNAVGWFTLSPLAQTF